MERKELMERLELACNWLTDIAQVKTKIPARKNVSRRHAHKYWKGAIKGEYSAANKQWGFFCPVWHTGQAVKALCAAYPLLKEKKILASARLGTEFIAANQINDEKAPDSGLILAYEDDPAKVNTSAILESLDGLMHFAGLSGEKEWREKAIKAAGWVLKNAYLKGQGLFLDAYDPQIKKFVPERYGVAGRPLADDAIFLKIYRLTGDRKFKAAFIECLNRLLRDENPPGNWIKYPPCNQKRGNIHPRHAYWWGLPMLYAYEETGAKKYLQCALRAGNWYVKAQRKDGGLFRGTYADFNTNSFGQASSGMACAMILWQEIERVTGKARYHDALALGLDYLLKMQFTTPKDKNLQGCILEKMVTPDGTDASPYYIRDLGTIFFIQALSQYLKR